MLHFLFLLLSIIAIGLVPTSSAFPDNGRHHRRHLRRQSSTPTALGCYIDSGTARLLNATVIKSATSITNKFCITECQNRGFRFSGTQTGTECWCGSTRPGDAFKKPLTECSSGCSGNKTELCGGYYRLTAWDLGVTPLSSSTITPLASSAISSIRASSTSYIIPTSSAASSRSAMSSSSIASPKPSINSTSIASSRPATITNSTSISSSRPANITSTSTSTSISISVSRTSATPSTSLIANTIPKTTASTIISTLTSKLSTIPGSTTVASASTLVVSKSTVSTISTITSRVPSSAPSLTSGTSAISIFNNATSTGSRIGSSTSLVTASANSISVSRNATSTQPSLLSTRSGSSNSSASASLVGSSTAVSSKNATTASITATPTSRINGTFGTSTASTSVVTSTYVPPAPTSYVVNPNIASSNSTEKKIWAHHMIGNTYPYQYNNWVQDIQLAQSAGIDGFALNLGPDEWQPNRISDAYRAAQALGFKLFLSFDMSVFNCVTTERIAFFQNYLNLYLPHPAAATFGGEAILSTFGGEWCTFGQANVTAGWATIMGSRRNSTYFMPAFTPGDGPRSLNKFDIDAQVNWGSAWPTGDADLTADNDNYWLSFLPNKYVATVSPLFFTHFGYKNWIYRSDDFLFSQRWEMLLGMRDRISQVEIISWNDYGESHYIGPIDGDQPPESKVWTMNPNIDHTAFLSLQSFYSSAWKTGALPKIVQDKIWITARPHPKGATATGDSVARPDGWDLTDDEFYAQVHLTGDANIVLSTNVTNAVNFAGKAGINRLAFPLQAGSGIKVQVIRAGSTVVQLTPAFTFVANPVVYSYNDRIWES